MIVSKLAVYEGFFTALLDYRQGVEDASIKQIITRFILLMLMTFIKVVLSQDNGRKLKIIVYQ